jgi:hypothetical protein
MAAGSRHRVGPAGASGAIASGTMERDEALGAVAGALSAIATGHPEHLTDNRESRAPCTDGVFRPVFDVFGQQPATPRGREDGLIDMVTEVASDIPNTVDSTGRPRRPPAAPGPSGGNKDRHFAAKRYDCAAIARNRSP